MLTPKLLESSAIKQVRGIKIMPVDSMSKFYRKIVDILSSRYFFYGVLVLFVIEAAYIALTGRYPMAFDEDFHYGLIQLYAAHLSPFFAHQPPNANQYGAVVRDPSYLYHYLMSFPYRIINYFDKGEIGDIIALRFINIGFVVASLVVFKKTFKKFIKASDALINTVLLFFILTPAVPLVSAQINYDNLLILFMSIDLFLALTFIKKLRNNNFDLKSFALLITGCCLTSLTMYSFLPIFAGIIFYISTVLLLKVRRGTLRISDAVRESYRSISLVTKVGLLLALIIGVGLFLERDGYNTLKYGTPIPQCNQVLSINDCKAYSPWYRNYQYAEAKSSTFKPSVSDFTEGWLHQVFFYSLFSVLNGSYSGYSIGAPMPLPQMLARIIFWVGIILVLIYHRKLFRYDNSLLLMAIVVGFYLFALWFQNFSDYVRLGTTVAEQGRYLVLILPVAYLIVAMAFRQLFERRYTLKSSLALTSVFLFLLQGGGIAPYVMASDSTWYWQNDNTAVKVNQSAKKVFSHIIIKKQ